MKHRGRIEWLGLKYCMITPRKARKRHKFYLAVEAAKVDMMKHQLLKLEPFALLSLTAT